MKQWFTTRRPRAGFLLLAAWILTGVPSARALYRGDEYEPRDFWIGSMYFVNRLNYLPWPEVQAQFDAADRALIGSGGSMGSSNLFLYQQFKLSQPMGPAFTASAEYLRDRDFDGTYQQLLMGLGYRLSPNWELVLEGQPTPDKSEADVGVVAVYQSDRLSGRMRWMWPDFVHDDKNSDDATMDRHAPNLQFETACRLSSAWSWHTAADLDFQRRLRHGAQAFEFQFEKHRAETALHWASDPGTVRLALEGEYARLSRAGLRPGDTADFALDRAYLALAIDYLRELEHGRLRAGGLYVHFDEDRLHPYDPDSSLWIDRQDRIAYVGRSRALREHVHLNTVAYLNLLHNRTVIPDEDRHRADRILLRASGSLIFRGEGFELETGAALNLHNTRFGGGFVKLLAAF